MTQKFSLAVSKAGLDFLKKMQVNRIKTGNSEIFESMTKEFDIIVKYFKNNNNAYLEMLSTKLEAQKNA